MNAHRPAQRLAALCAALVMSVLVIASQLGLAEHYVTAADAMLAARQAPHLAQGASAPAPRRPNS